MSKFASFLVGMGGGYIKARDKEYERERQAKEDAWHEEQRNRQRAEWSEKDAIKTSMKDAFADRSTIEGTAVTGTTGTNLYKDPGQAQAMADEARIEAEMRGESPSAVATTKATGITGNMSKGQQITTEPVDLKALNSRDAKMARGVNALMAAGDPEKAISMENVVMENQAKKLGLDAAQLKFADDQFNRKLQETLSREGDFWGNASQVLTDTNQGGLAGVQVKPVVTADGKMVQLVGVKDGKEQVMFSAPNTAEGQLAFVQRVSKADPVTKISWLKEGAEREAAKAKAALEQRRVEVLEKNAATNERKLDGLLLRGMGGGGSGARNGKADEVQQPSMPDPMAGFDNKKAQAVALEIAQAEFANETKPATPKKIAERAVAIYRGLEGEFKNTGLSSLAAQAFAQSARNASTQNDVAALYQQGLSNGMSPSQMAEIDPRMAPLAHPPKQEAKKKEPAKPSVPARPLTTFESMRQNKLAEEAANRKSREQSEKEAREAERQRLLKQRPDLQQMGGMRFFN